MSISSCNILLLVSFSLDNNGLRQHKTKRQRNVFHLELRRPPLRYPWCKEIWWEKEILVSLCHFIGIMGASQYQA